MGTETKQKQTKVNSNIPLREYIESQFKIFNEKIDYIIHPKTGIFVELANINTKADAAHRRIDDIEAQKLQKEQEKKSRKELWQKIIIGAVSAASAFLLKFFIG